MLTDSFGKAEGTENVVANPLGNIVFNHRDMLVGCGMVDDRWLVDANDIGNMCLICDVSEERDDECAKIIFQVQLNQAVVNIKEVVFCIINKKQFGGLKGKQLQGEFTSNAASCTGYHNDFTGNGVYGQLIAEWRGIATKEIFDIYFFDFGDGDFTFGEVLNVWQEAKIYRIVLEVFDNLQPTETSNFRAGQENVFNVMSLNDRQGIAWAIDHVPVDGAPI